MKQARQIFWNALLLTAASLLMRTVGVGFQVAVSNQAGAEVMGLYSLMSGVYGTALTLATAGIHLGVTRLVAESVSRGDTEGVGRVMKKASLYALLCGLIASALLLLFADRIGALWIKDTRTVPSLRLLAITLPLISLTSVFGGYFTAVKRPYCSAAVQVLEQGVRIGVTMHWLPLLAKGNTEQMLCALVLGGALAEILSFLVELPIYLLDKRRSFPKRTRQRGDEGRQLLRITLPMAVTALIRSGLLTLEHILIPEGLRKSGHSHALALGAYGCIQSMAIPIVLYPAALISSFSGLLIPTLAECRVQGFSRRICYMIGRVWSLALLFSIGVAGILLTFSTELGELLYPGTEAGRYIRILAPLVPIMYVDTATDAMLKGLGDQIFSMKINLLDAGLSVILVWLLVPRMGIGGYLVTIYLSECINTVCSIVRLLTLSGTKTRLFKWIYKPLLSIVVSTAIVRWGGRCLFPNATFTPIHFILCCVVTLLLYLLLLRLTGGIDREDLDWFATLFRKESRGSTETGGETVCPP